VVKTITSLAIIMLATYKEACLMTKISIKQLVKSHLIRISCNSSQEMGIIWLKKEILWSLDNKAQRKEETDHQTKIDNLTITIASQEDL